MNPTKASVSKIISEFMQKDGSIKRKDVELIQKTFLDRYADKCIVGVERNEILDKDVMTVYSVTTRGLKTCATYPIKN